MPKSAEDKAQETIQRRNKSRDWLRDTFWDEWAEIWQFYKCRTEPILDERTGKEDETQTNLCMPDAWIMARRKAARLSRRPPTIRVRASNPDLSERLSAWSAYQWDRTDEQRFHRRHVLQSVLFGFSLKEISYDEIVQTYRFRRSSEELLSRLGVVVNEDDNGINYSIPDGSPGQQVRPYDSFNSTQRADILSRFPMSQFQKQRVKKYEGPMANWVFIGDYYPEPEFDGVHTSAWNIIEQYQDLSWLAYWANQTFTDPDSSKEYPVFDKKAVQELADMTAYNKAPDDDTNFKDRLMSVLNKERPPSHVSLLPGKRFLITKEYTLKDGWPHMRFVGNEKILLTPVDVPLPWDLYGHYPLSSLTLIPDLLSGFGDSSPLRLRHIIRLHNVTVSQRTDYMTAVLKPLALVRDGADIPGEVIDRGLLRVLRVRNPEDYKIERMGSVPPEAFSSEAQIQRTLQLAEPAMIDFGTQSQAVPSSQRVATLGVLQAKAQESLSQDELDALNESLGLETKIKLWMLQQSMTDEMSFPEVKQHALSSSATGEPRMIRLDPLEIQEDLEVFPEFASTLGLDDADRRDRAMEVWQMSQQDPVVFNKYEAAKRLAVAAGVPDPESIVRPEPPPTPPPPPVRVNFSFNDKFSDLPQSWQEALGQELGLPPVSPEAYAKQQEERAAQNVEAAGKFMDTVKTAHDILQPRDMYGENVDGEES